jgi:arginyl-tRNA synthetase
MDFMQVIVDLLRNKTRLKKRQYVSGSFSIIYESDPLPTVIVERIDGDLLYIKSDLGMMKIKEHSVKGYSFVTFDVIREGFDIEISVPSHGWRIN